MEFKVLGPLLVSAGDRPVAIGSAPKRLLVLAVLLARAGQPVPTDLLVEAVWNGTRPPASARRNIQLYVHQLRRTLPDGLISGRGTGYAIEVRDRLDAARFCRLVTEGGACLEAGDPATAGTVLRTALDLWRGPAFAEFLDCRPVADEARRLELLRLEAYERWAEAQLATGATPALVVELTELCRLHPYRETLRGHLMRALYQSGRQTEALATYRGTRALLAGHLGVEPGPALRELHQAMLRGDPALAPAGRAGSRPASRPAVPRQLPPAPVAFTGRREALGLLDRALRDPAPPVLICGMGGVGKTALAVHWGHGVADRFPDGQLFLDLRGSAPGGPVRPEVAVGLLLRGLGVAAAEVPADLAAATGRYRSLLAGRRVLVVLDNARDAGQVRPLLPAAPGCLALVTSRDRLTGLVARDGARRVSLDILHPAEAASLVGQLVPGTEPPAAAALARACGHLPLALRIAAAHLTDRPGRTVAGYAAELRSDLAALDAGGDPDASVRSAFASSYDALAPAARRLFRLLGVVPGPDLTGPAAAALAGTDPPRARRLLDTLARAHLVDPVGPDRYALHDLLRAYAAELARSAGGAEPAGATARLHDFYLTAVDAAADLLYPRRQRLPIQVPDGFPHRTGFPDRAAAAGWLDAEIANLVAVVEHAAGHGPRRVAWLLAGALGGYFELRARYGPHWLVTAEAGLAAAIAEGDQRVLATSQLGLAVAHRMRGRPDRAIVPATAALALSRQVSCPSREAEALRCLGAAQAELGEIQPALAAFDRALRVIRRVPGRPGEAGLLASRCGLRVRTGQLRAALRDGLAALAIYQVATDPAGEPHAQFNTGVCYLNLGEWELAGQHLTRAADLFAAAGERYSQTLARCALTKVHIDAGRISLALQLATGTLADSLRAGFDACAVFSLLDLVEARRALGDRRHAVRDCVRAVRLARRTGRYVEAFARVALAEAHLHDRRLDQALASAAAAHRLTARYGYRLLEGRALRVRGEIRLAGGDRAGAIADGAAALAIHQETGDAGTRAGDLLDRAGRARHPPPGLCQNEEP